VPRSAFSVAFFFGSRCRSPWYRRTANDYRAALNPTSLHYVNYFLDVWARKGTKW
jgi:hypothetical protein